MKRFSLMILSAVVTQLALAQIPKLGNDTLLDVATWNIEWFGDTGNGPSDETLQFNNVKNVIMATDFDIMGLAEISNTTTFANLGSQISSKYSTYISTFSATQKTAFLYKSSMFQLIGSMSGNILTESTYSYNFASRPPLMVTLSTMGGNKIDTLIFIIVHMKANTESTDAGRFESYNRRKNASITLRTYMEQNHPTKKFMIIGDWNDDLNTSVYNNIESPYKNYLDSGYIFPTKELTNIGKKSYAFGTKMIDHILNSKTLDSFYYTGSASVFDNAGTYVNNFSNTTSDHYIVYARYDWKKLTIISTTTPIEEQTVMSGVSAYPNPASESFFIQGAKTGDKFALTNAIGQEVMIGLVNSDLVEIKTGILSTGIYFLRLQNQNNSRNIKIIIE